MPATVNLSVYQGDDYDAVVQVFGPDGLPADLSLYQAYAHVREGAAQTYPVMAEIATSIVGNIVLLEISAADTLKLSGRLAWDLQLVSTEGRVTTIAEGSVLVTGDITRVLHKGKHGDVLS